MKKSLFFLALATTLTSAACSQQDPAATQTASTTTTAKTQAKPTETKTMSDNQNLEFTTTASGLQYAVLQEGSGAKPTASDTVQVHYAGTLSDGTEFDSSYKRGEPIEFPLSGVIAGWTEGVQLMTVGSKYRFIIPANLAYGERGIPGVIPGGAALNFDVELLDIVK